MARAGDEPDACTACRARRRISEDGLTYRFLLRPEASFTTARRSPPRRRVLAATLKDKGHPIATQLLRDFEGAEATGRRHRGRAFQPNAARDVPLFVARRRSSRAPSTQAAVRRATLEAPLGWGPYKVGRFGGHYIEFERVKDWWGEDLPVVARAEQLRPYATNIIAIATSPSRASPKEHLFREEFTSRTWATRYDFPAIKRRTRQARGGARRTPSGAQGWFINMRRAKFRPSACAKR